MDPCAAFFISPIKARQLGLALHPKYSVWLNNEASGRLLGLFQHSLRSIGPLPRGQRPPGSIFRKLQSYTVLDLRTGPTRFVMRSTAFRDVWAESASPGFYVQL